MNKEEIIKGNKLICLFACNKNEDGTINSITQGGYPVGTMHFSLTHCPINTIYPFNHEWHYINSGEWHYNWSWLMPIVQKCIDLEIYSSNQTNELHDGLLFVNIEQVWQACVDFIKEYNERKKI